MNEREIVTPIHVMHGGRQWHLFIAEYTNDDGAFTLHFHALSLEHAAAVVEEIRETLVLKGQVIGEISP